MKKGKEGKRRILVASLVIVFAVLAIALLWYTQLYFKQCGDAACFSEELAKCNHAKFVNFGNMTFEYKILGEEGGSCQINVRFLNGDISNQEMIALDKKEMVCSLPLGVVASPDSDTANCHGLLKEELQDLIIANLHRYIVQNLGKINIESA